MYQRIVMVCAALSSIAILSLEYAFINYLLLFSFLIFLLFDALKNNINKSLQWQPDGQWLIKRNGFQHTAMLQSGSVVTPYFAALKFKLQNKQNLNVVLFKDNIDADKFRQLRVRLKVEGIKSRPEVSMLTDH